LNIKIYSKKLELTLLPYTINMAAVSDLSLAKVCELLLKMLLNRLLATNRRIFMEISLIYPYKI